MSNSKHKIARVILSYKEWIRGFRCFNELRLWIELLLLLWRFTDLELPVLLSACDGSLLTTSSQQELIRLRVKFFDQLE